MKPYFGIGTANKIAAQRYDMALALMEDGDVSSAIPLLYDARKHDSKWPPIHFFLGEALRVCGQPEEAQNAFTDYLRLDPADAMGAGIKLAFMGARDAEAAMSQTYVKVLYDQYAPQFDAILLSKLKYKVPVLVAQNIGGDFDTLLDLGCGTGLAAQQFLGRAINIEGVDISQGMINEARTKNIYTHLHTMNIEDYLSQCSQEFDLILCLDVLIYMGDISSLFSKIARVMKEGGALAFSTQKFEGTGDMILGDDHRYAHAHSYIERLLKEAGLKITQAFETDIRKDGAGYIRGYIYIVEKMKRA